MYKPWCPYKLALSILLLVSYGVVNGCAPTFSRQLRQRAVVPVPFRELLAKGGDYEGELVVLGGHILKTLNEPDGSQVTILQAPLDSRDKPKSQDLSEGRFLVRTKEFLDPEIYSKGRKVSVLGRFSGVLAQELGNRLYPYPVIEVEELRLWPKEEPRIRPHWDYWHDPWHPFPRRFYPWWGW